MGSKKKWLSIKLTDEEQKDRIKKAEPARDSLNRIKHESYDLREYLRQLSIESRLKIREIKSNLSS